MMDRVIKEFRWCLGNYILNTHLLHEETAAHFKDRMYQTKLCLSLLGHEIDFDLEFAIQQLLVAYSIGLIND